MEAGERRSRQAGVGRGGGNPTPKELMGEGERKGEQGKGGRTDGRRPERGWNRQKRGIRR